jgi:serine/threonine protein phosphatase 1
MLSSLWPRTLQQKLGRPRVPPRTRLYAIGDILGRADLVEDMYRLISEDARRAGAPRNVIVYLGDYIDRGIRSREVINLLLGAPLTGFEHIHLKGNHDDCLIRFLIDDEVAELWLSHGCNDTLRSYGIAPPRRLSDTLEVQRAQRQLRQALPGPHVSFFLRLKLNHVEGDYFFVHAGIRPDAPLEDQTANDMLWIDGEFLNSDIGHGKVIVHGHSIAARPEVRWNRIGIDTGAYTTGKLTCLVLQRARRRFLQT